MVYIKKKERLVIIRDGKV